MRKSYTELSALASERGYAGDEYVTSCLETIAELEKEASKGPPQPANGKFGNSVLFGLLAILVTILTLVGLRIHVLRAEIANLRITMELEGKVMATTKELVKELDADLDSAREAAKTSADASRAASADYASRLDQLAASVSALAAKPPSGTNEPPSATKPTEGKRQPAP